MSLKNNSHMVFTIGEIKIPDIKVGNQSDIEQPVQSVSVSADGEGGFSGNLILKSGKQINFTIPAFIYDATSSIYKVVKSNGVNLYVTTGLYALIMSRIHDLVLTAKINNAKDNDKYALSLSKDRLTGAYQSLKSMSLLELSVVSWAFAIDEDGTYYTTSEFIPTLFDNVVFERRALVHKGHIMDITGGEPYMDAVIDALANSDPIRDIKSKIGSMIKLPRLLKVSGSHPLIGKVLSSRKSLELCFHELLKFDVWPSEMELSTFDAMPAYIKGRLYKLALDNRSELSAVITRGQHDTLASFFSSYKNLQAFISAAVYPLQDTSDPNSRMSYLEKVLKSSSVSDVSQYFDARVSKSNSIDEIKSDLRALGHLITVLLCDAGSIVINGNGSYTIEVPVYDSAFLSYYQSGLVKIAYRK